MDWSEEEQREKYFYEAIRQSIVSLKKTKSNLKRFCLVLQGKVRAVPHAKCSVFSAQKKSGKVKIKSLL